MPSQRKTRNLKLSQWQGNEFVSFSDIAEDNEKIDNKIGMIDMALQGKVNSSDIQGLLGSVDISGKVDKIPGKGLSTNDYTNADKQKVNNLPVNVNAELSRKVNATSGKGLSTNDFTDEYKEALDGLPSSILKLTAEIASRIESGEREMNSLKQSVVDGKQRIATAINDVNGSTVASASMTHGDLSVAMRNVFKSKNLVIFDKNKQTRTDASNKMVLYILPGTINYSNESITTSTNEILLIKQATSGKYETILGEDIDFSLYNYLVIRAKNFISNGLYVRQIDNINSRNILKREYLSKSISVGKCAIVDISTWTGRGNLLFTHDNNSNYYVEEIKLYK